MGGGVGAAGLALQTIGTLYGGFAANSQGQAQSAALIENGRRTILQGEMDAQEVRRQERMTTGDLLVQQGGSGFQMGSGSLADLISQNAYNRETDIYNIRSKASGDAAALYDQAAMARAKGRDALIGSAFSAVSTALTGATKLRQQGILADQAETERTTMGGGTSGVWDERSIVLGPGVRVPRISVLNY